jgi:hypothetical protein
VEWKVLVYPTFLIILFMRELFVTQSILVVGQHIIPRVIAGKPYDPNIAVTKLEYTGHVQKRTEARLRRIVKEKRGTILHDSKPLRGKGRLTQSEIDSREEECQ